MSLYTFIISTEGKPQSFVIFPKAQTNSQEACEGKSTLTESMIVK